MSKALGIFQGKKANYNQLILKALATGDKNNMQISEYILNNDPRRARIEKINRRNETLKIQSDISKKKGGRLEELRSKDYITRKDNMMWELTFKGFAVALTLMDVDEVPHNIVAKTFQGKEGKDFINKASNYLIPRTLRSDFINFMNEISSTHNFLFVRSKTEDMIRHGVNLDEMSKDDFLAHMTTHIILHYNRQKWPRLLEELLRN